MDNKTEIVELNAQCDALIKKYLAGESSNAESKSEMLRLLAKRQTWTRKSNGQKVLHKSKSLT
jgi:hypothetical protein